MVPPFYRSVKKIKTNHSSKAQFPIYLLINLLLPTAIKIHCNFSTVSKIALTVGMGIILQKGNRATLGGFVKSFTQALLPAATSLRTMGEGSLCFTVQAENKQALEALWQRYQDGTLQRNLQEFLVTDDIRQLAGGEEVILSAYIDEQDYNNAWLGISIAEQQGE